MGWSVLGGFVCLYAYEHIYAYVCMVIWQYAYASIVCSITIYIHTPIFDKRLCDTRNYVFFLISLPNPAFFSSI